MGAVTSSAMIARRNRFFMFNLEVFIQMIIRQLRLKFRASKSLNGCVKLASRDLGRENEMFSYFVDLHCIL